MLKIPSYINTTWSYPPLLMLLGIIHLYKHSLVEVLLYICGVGFKIY
jgi:hypothetical protein